MNLLLITSHFPSYDCPEASYATPFLFNYAKEWVRQGHEVHVIHFSRHYPKGFNSFANFVSKFGYTKLEKFVIDPIVQMNNEYIYKNVFIHRLGYLKTIPHGFASKKTVYSLSNQVLGIIESMSAIPDVIIGDCVDPVIHVIDIVRQTYNIKYYQILHDSDISSLQNKHICRIIKQTECLFLRSKKQLPLIENIIGKHEFKYMYSGIPASVVNYSFNPRVSIKRLIYIGALYRSKGLETILLGIKQSKNKDLHLQVIGDGVDAQYFRNRVKELDINQQVEFIGKVPHDEVFSYLKKADMLLLISVETFGMVYIEAMSQGCIPVGAKNEGIDGILINGDNGFLTPLNDYHSLANLLDSVECLSREQITNISINAFNTASVMTESMLATDLLEYIKS